jgi:hypothetical protein
LLHLSANEQLLHQAVGGRAARFYIARDRPVIEQSGNPNFLVKLQLRDSLLPDDNRQSIHNSAFELNEQTRDQK